MKPIQIRALDLVIQDEMYNLCERDIVEIDGKFYDKDDLKESITALEHYITEGQIFLPYSKQDGKAIVLPRKKAIQYVRKMLKGTPVKAS